MNQKKIQLTFIASLFFFLVMCVPPQGETSSSSQRDKAKLDSLRKIKCPRLMSSAAEYYRNRNWKKTVNIYSEITNLSCDEWNPLYAPPQEIYQYYAIAYEQMGKFDSSEYVLLDGLQKLPKNIELRKRLAYSYKKQGKSEKEIIEYERLVEMDPQNISIMNDLSKIYKDENRFEDQIFVLEKILKINGNNETAQSELALAFESSGRDPLEVYRSRYEDNPENLSYGLDYAERLSQVDRYEDAIIVLNNVIYIDPSSKIAYRKIAEAHKNLDNLNEAAKAFEELFKIDSRDVRIAIEISEVFLLNNEFGKALRWADKSVGIDNKLGDAYAQKAKVFYYGWDNYNQNPFTIDDRIVAKLSYDNYVKAESKGYRGVSKKKWFEDNAKDVLYGKAQWFMADDKVKRTRVISTLTSNYDWVTESLKAESTWK
jgi:tetratricopeptide (TPR) repeat protein